MNSGSATHSIGIIKPLSVAFDDAGFRVELESPVEGPRPGFIDLLARGWGQLCAVEVELTPKRVPRDIEKAIDAGADALWIVVPTGRVARAVRRQLNGVEVCDSTLRILVLTLPQALQQLHRRASSHAGSSVDRQNGVAATLPAQTADGNHRS